MTEREPKVDALDATMTSGRGDTPGAVVQKGGGGGSLVGRRLAHFRIERPLGRGGMGEVYLATDLALDRPVALKLLGREVASNERLRERFYREARAQARINHPNVGHIYYIGEEDEQLFFAMEYIEGESLQERLARDGKIAPEQAVELCRMAALGLREAKRHGFTHRDIKPSNLMIDRHGVVKVVDFGIVKQQHDEAGPPAAADQLTGSGGTTLIGTPLYMAPEQARGEPVDHRADMYALGATLHHLVAGQPPFRGETAMAIVSQHLADPRPRLPAGKRRGATTAVDALCERMMAKRPDERFGSYDDLVAAMEQASPAMARPAGFWVRAFALAIDFLLVTMVLIPVSILASEEWGTFALPVAGMVYSILLHGRWGQTLGKLALELEVVPTGRPGRLGYRGALRRFLVQWGLSFAAYGATEMLELSGGSLPVFIGRIAATVLMVLPPLVCGVASIWSEGKRTVWDRLSGSQVRYRRAG